MKRLLFAAVSIVSAALCAAENITLPAPDKQGGKPFMQVLTDRKTIRDFAEK